MVKEKVEDFRIASKRAFSAILANISGAGSC